MTISHISGRKYLQCVGTLYDKSNGSLYMHPNIPLLLGVFDHINNNVKYEN